MNPRTRYDGPVTTRRPEPSPTDRRARVDPGRPRADALGRSRAVHQPRAVLARVPNARVLNEASDEKVPLYERLKFLAIYAGNLDEFFMVRVAGLQAQISGEVEEVPPDGLTPDHQLAAIRSARARAHRRAISNLESRPQERAACSRRRSGQSGRVVGEGPGRARPAFSTRHLPGAHADRDRSVHPFPHVRNKSINVGVIFEKRAHTTEPAFGLVQVPTMLRA